MRIAYVANYQGQSLVKNRPCSHNLSLAARVKIELISELLIRSSHEVDIISQGALEPLPKGRLWRSKLYSSAVEREPFHPRVQIDYASAISVRLLTGLWESLQCQRLLRRRHRSCPYDVVIVYNMQRGQIGCARFAVHRLGVPVILQYEDDAFVDIYGLAGNGLLSRHHRKVCREVLGMVSGGMAVSPYLLGQFPSHIPRVLLRGVVSKEILNLMSQGSEARKNRVVFSGTHEKTQGLEQLIAAWSIVNLPDWELHIAGGGPLSPTLKKMAAGSRSIVFHGLLNRQENARLLCGARIGMNPQDITRTPGNVFAFKMVEYLAAGTHVITTPRGYLERELEEGVTYINDNRAETIATSMRRVITEQRFERTAVEAAVETYGPDAVSMKLNRLLEQVTRRNGSYRRSDESCCVSSGSMRSDSRGSGNDVCEH